MNEPPRDPRTGPGSEGRPGSEATPALERMAGAISDGAPVAWESERSVDPETVEALRLIENVARLHRSNGRPRPEPAPMPSTWGNLQIRGPLGAGTYGEVFRAYDPGLRREVALKLWGATARPRTIERLLEEARALARVRHPNVLLVHGADTHDDRVGMWSELLEGATLEDLLVHHGVCDWREAAVYGMQLCRALSAVHAAGLVHRDVKAANVMRERGGRIVLMDFGSASRHAPGDPHEDDAARADTSRAGSSGPQGTPLNMAPEVLAGDQATPAADVYSLAVLLYRQICGRFPVEADSLDQLRERLAREPLPSLGTRSAQVPLSFVQVIDRALERDPAKRIATSAEFERQLAEALRSDWEPAGTATGSGAGSPPRPARLRRAAWAAALLGVLALGAWWWHERTEVLPETQPMQFTLRLPQGEHLPQFANVAVSPEGTQVVFASTDSSGRSALWLRRFDALNCERLPGTTGARYPFWSPDGHHIGFFTDSLLMRIGAEGESVRTVCRAELGRGGTWNATGTIVFAASTQGPLLRVPAAGGTPIPITSVDSASREVSHRWPWFLPDGDHFLYVTTPASNGKFMLYVGSIRSDRRIRVGEVESGAVFSQGLLVYTNGNALQARPFDMRALRWRGPEIPLSARPGFGGAVAEPHASVSANGTLVHVSAEAENSRLVWYSTSSGDTTTFAVGPFYDPRLSPDGRRVAVERVEGVGRSNLWMLDVRSGQAERWTNSPELNRKPIWSPRGDSILYSSNRTGNYALYVRGTGGSLSDRVVFAPARALLMWPNDWPANGRLTFDRFEPGSGYDVYELRDGVAVEIASTPASELRSSLSPDGHWLAYDCDASGMSRIHLLDRQSGEAFALAGAGGIEPRWVRNTGRLIYHTTAGEFIECTPRPGRSPMDWSQRSLFRAGALGGYDVDPSGARILCSVKSPSGQPEEVAVLVNLKAAAAKGL